MSVKALLAEANACSCEAMPGVVVLKLRREDSQGLMQAMFIELSPRDACSVAKLLLEHVLKAEHYASTFGRR